MPDPDNAFKQASSPSSVKHPSVIWALKTCRDVVQGTNAGKAKAEFSKRYRLALEKAREGFEFPEPKPNPFLKERALPSLKATPESSQAHIDALRKVAPAQETADASE